MQLPSYLGEFHYSDFPKVIFCLLFSDWNLTFWLWHVSPWMN